MSRELLARAWAAGAGPGDGPLTIDLDSTICETYGLAKEGARHHGYTGKRGYHPLLAVAAGTGDVLMSRLREGRANVARPHLPAWSVTPGDMTTSALMTMSYGLLPTLIRRGLSPDCQGAQSSTKCSGVPALFTALKREIDRNRAPGQFLLTGSSQVLLLPSLSDSLAGRMEILRLHPLSQNEMHGGAPNFLDDLFNGAFRTRVTDRLADDLAVRITAGGYPAAVARATARRRANWYRSYVETQLERDVRDIFRIRDLSVLPRLLNAASQTAHLYNLADLAGPFQLSRPTIGDYVELLERLFLIDRLPPWHNNRLNRLIKTPKLHLGDTGVGCALLGLNPGSLTQDRTLLGQFLETFVFQELKRQAICQEQPLSFFHYRDKDQAEVDIVIERSSRVVAGVEVKAAATVTPGDFRGLRKLKKAAGDWFASGVVLYDGEITTSFGDRMFAVPIRSLCEGRTVGLGSFTSGLDRLAP